MSIERNRSDYRTFTDGDGKLGIFKAVFILLQLGLPTAVSFCATTISNTVSFAFVGSHTDEMVQAAHALGYSIGNILVLMVGLGLINGMDTLCPLAIGSGRPQDCWAYLIQAFAIVGVTMILLLPVIFFSTELLILCKQDPLVALHAGQYLQAGTLGLVAICMYEALRKFLIFHRYHIFQTVVSLFSIPLQILFLWIFVSVYQLGARGAGIARSLTWIVMASGLLLYVIFRREAFSYSLYLSGGRKDEVSIEVQLPCNNRTDHEMVETHGSPTTMSQGDSSAVAPCTEIDLAEMRSDITRIQTTSLADTRNSDGTPTAEFSSDAPLHHRIERMPSDNEPWWKGVSAFLRIAVPSTLLCVFEWISFEMQIFEASYLGAIELAGLAASASLGTLIFFVSLSVGVTVNSEVGRAMGRLHPWDGHTVTKAGILASLSISIPIASLVLALRYPIASFFSSSPSVQEAIRGNLLPLSMVIIFDSLHVILGGAIKALNLQCYASVFDAIGLLGVMQLVGLLLAYNTTLKGRGFVIGTIVGVMCVDTCYSIMLFCFVNWPRRAKTLIGRGKSKSLPPSQ